MTREEFEKFLRQPWPATARLTVNEFRAMPKDERAALAKESFKWSEKVIQDRLEQFDLLANLARWEARLSVERGGYEAQKVLATPLAEAERQQLQKRINEGLAVFGALLRGWDSHFVDLAGKAIEMVAEFSDSPFEPMPEDGSEQDECALLADIYKRPLVKLLHYKDEIAPENLISATWERTDLETVKFNPYRSMEDFRRCYENGNFAYAIQHIILKGDEHEAPDPVRAVMSLKEFRAKVLKEPEPKEAEPLKLKPKTFRRRINEQSKTIPVSKLVERILSNNRKNRVLFDAFMAYAVLNRKTF